MSVKHMMTVEEYLHTSFEPDCEYLDGEIVERNMGEIPHSSIGVEWVWVVDPQERAALSYSRNHPEGAAVTTLSTQEPNIQIPLEAAFDLNS